MFNVSRKLIGWIMRRINISYIDLITFLLLASDRVVVVVIVIVKTSVNDGMDCVQARRTMIAIVWRLFLGTIIHQLSIGRLASSVSHITSRRSGLVQWQRGRVGVFPIRWALVRRCTLSCPIVWLELPIPFHRGISQGTNLNSGGTRDIGAGI